MLPQGKPTHSASTDVQRHKSRPLDVSSAEQHALDWQAMPSSVAARVQPIIQSDPNAGYDSGDQYRRWWFAAGCAATLTEVLRAWGVSEVTIGRIIYEFGQDLTSWGGLLNQSAWNRVAQYHYFQATMQWDRQLSYEEIVRLTAQQGIPVILGVRDQAGRYYAAFWGGHYLVAVGGDSAGLHVVDSSTYHLAYLTRDEFDYLWTGETILITPW